MFGRKLILGKVSERGLTAIVSIYPAGIVSITDTVAVGINTYQGIRRIIRISPLHRSYN